MRLPRASSRVLWSLHWWARLAPSQWVPRTTLVGRLLVSQGCKRYGIDGRIQELLMNQAQEAKQFLWSIIWQARMPHPAQNKRSPSQRVKESPAFIQGWSTKGKSMKDKAQKSKNGWKAIRICRKHKLANSRSSCSSRGHIERQGLLLIPNENLYINLYVWLLLYTNY